MKNNRFVLSYDKIMNILTYTNINICLEDKRLFYYLYENKQI